VKPGGGDSGESGTRPDFQEAARAVAAEAPGPEPSEAPSVAKLEGLTISADHAREVVKFCFWPLAHYVDPLWALSDAEAEKATPQMQKFLEWLLLKYIPAFALKLAARFPELLAMLVAMALLAWHKSQIVMAAQRQGRTAFEHPSPVAMAGEAPIDETPYECEVCHRLFVGRQGIAAHLPCVVA